MTCWCQMKRSLPLSSYLPYFSETDKNALSHSPILRCALVFMADRGKWCSGAVQCASASAESCLAMELSRTITVIGRLTSRLSSPARFSQIQSDPTAQNQVGMTSSVFPELSRLFETHYSRADFLFFSDSAQSPGIVTPYICDWVDVPEKGE
jgi:hypothetical protein